jgi:hypothetical protein
MSDPTSVLRRPPITGSSALLVADGRAGAPAAPTRRHTSARRVAPFGVVLALRPAPAALATRPRYRAARRCGRERLSGGRVAATAIREVEGAIRGSGAPARR